MTELKFRTEKPIAYYDKSKGVTIPLTADFTVHADTVSESDGKYIPLYAMTALNDAFYEYGKTVPYEELESRYAEISGIVSEKLTEKLGCACRAELTALTTDEKTAKLLEQMKLAEKMKDPAFAAAEMERALQKARETAEKHGIDPSALQNMPMPELPPIPDGLDPLARAQAIAERQKQLEQMAKTGTFAAAPAATAATAATAAPAAQRPKFCTECGAKLPESGNFCPSCGHKI